MADPNLTQEQAMERYERLKAEAARAQAEMDAMRVAMLADLVSANIGRLGKQAAAEARGTAIITMPIIGNDRAVHLIVADEFKDGALIFLEKPFKEAGWTTHKIYAAGQKKAVDQRRYGYWRYGAQFVMAANNGGLKSKKYADFVDLTDANPPADTGKTGPAAPSIGEADWSIRSIAEHALNAVEGLALATHVSDQEYNALIDALCAELQQHKK